MDSLSVMIVDDDAGDRKALVRYLGRGPHSAAVVEAATAGDALARPEEHFDAIFLDYRLPDGSGLDAMGALRARWPRAAIILLTGQGSEAVATSAILSGASDYAPKLAINANAVARMLHNGVSAARARTRIAEQREDLETFADVLVHDFRAPIRAALHLAEQIDEDIGDNDMEGARRGLALLRASANRMTEMLTSLSDHVRTDRGAGVARAAPADLIAQALAALERDIEESGASITVAPLDGVPDILCAPPQIALVLQNLVANAIKYSGADAPRIRLETRRRDGGLVEVLVEDRGLGIPEPYRARVFEPFKRLPGRANVTGTGLGLATCRKIVGRHGGRIWCDGAGADGVGTRMRVMLPVDGPPAARDASDPAPSAPATDGPGRAADLEARAAGRPASRPPRDQGVIRSG